MAVPFRAVAARLSITAILVMPAAQLLAAESARRSDAPRVMCDERAALLKSFADNYQEKPAVQALTDAGTLLDVLVSPKGTWTMLVTPPRGPACIVATGQSWEQILEGPTL
jgi:hypothetical protein